MSNEKLPRRLPILALRNTVLFPGIILPITVGRDSSIRLVQDACEGNKLLGVVSQRQHDEEDPDGDDLYSVGTMATILKRIQMPDGTKNIVIQGTQRFRVRKYTQDDPYFKAKIGPFPEEEQEDEIQLEALLHSIKTLAIEIVSLSPHIPNEAADAIENFDAPDILINFIASNLQLSVEEKQTLLEKTSLSDQARLVLEHLNRERQVMTISEDLRNRMKDEVDQQQREFYLRKQMQLIQKELGEEDESSDLDSLRERAAEKEMPEHVQKSFKEQLKKLNRTNPAAPDYAVVRNYVDWLLDLPWDSCSKDHLDIGNAETVLDEDHYGLDKVKKRIVEYLAVLKLKGDMKAPILCFYGPPGVGKTSLGQSIARAIDRKFVRISLGGVRDEAEIRGHRRTYIGALPGRILQGLKKAGTSNPVFMLDEVDKLASHHLGDPSSALLEVLDPEQNSAFNDHYIELDYDLSKVLFIATANSLQQIPAPLRDRMEMINITGYTLEEKLCIAKGYLVPRQIDRNGLTPEQFEISDDALSHIIDGYTRESGVRQLERTIGSVIRGVAKKVATDEDVTGGSIDRDDLNGFLGAKQYFSDVAERTEVPGVSTGLAWTPTGGDILFVEASVSRGSGKLILSGSLGDIMKESAQAALSYVKSKAEVLRIPVNAFRKWDLHVHVPAGAVSKDGPSAGVAMISALASIFTQRRVRHDLAMTGEITLRGLVLPVGGIKEKVLAAKRAGIKTVVLPLRNEKDVLEINQDALEGLQVSYIRRMQDALDLTLETEAVTDPQSFFQTRS
ncbi:MAG: endopeptidase La [Bacteroidota bacterium]|nr:endopeptidase La [Bacteroidota bacterium]